MTENPQRSVPALVRLGVCRKPRSRPIAPLQVRRQRCVNGVLFTSSGTGRRLHSIDWRKVGKKEKRKKSNQSLCYFFTRARIDTILGSLAGWPIGATVGQGQTRQGKTGQRKDPIVRPHEGVSKRRREHELDTEISWNGRLESQGGVESPLS
jgi:hypothetical protein